MLITALAALAVATSQPTPPPIYRIDSVTVLTGTQPGWDYLTMDSLRGYLFIGRRAAGVSVYDIKARKEVRKIDNSEGANIATLVPSVGRGYTANGDGSTTVFDLKTLNTLDRIKLGDGADAAFFDAATSQVVFTMGDTQQLTFIDAATGKVTGHVKTEASELEGVAPDGQGNLFVAERDVNRVAVVNAKTHVMTTEWLLPGCEQPTGMALDHADHRLFVGCKGANPVLTVLNTDNGSVVAQMPIGRGNDGVIYDASQRKVFTSNGVEGNIVIFDQTGPDSYSLAQAVTTRPIARTLAMDPDSHKLYTVTAEGMVDPARPINTRAAPFYPNLYFDDTFMVIELSQHSAPSPAAAEED